MGLFGGKSDTKAKMDELRARLDQPTQPQQGPPQGFEAQPQPWQQQPQQYQAPEQPWQQQAPPPSNPAPRRTSHTMENDTLGIELDLGAGMSLNLPIREKMRLEEFLQIADRVRELTKNQQHHH